jgi:hypothetical protein
LTLTRVTISVTRPATLIRQRRIKVELGIAPERGPGPWRAGSAAASSSPTWHDQPSASSLSTISAARRSSGFKEGKSAIKWTGLSCLFLCRQRRPPPVPCPGLQLGQSLRTLAKPKTAEPWSLSSVREKLIKIGAKVVNHGRYVTFQMAEFAVSRQMFAEILSLIARLRRHPRPHERGVVRWATGDGGRGRGAA